MFDLLPGTAAVTVSTVLTAVGGLAFFIFLVLLLVRLTNRKRVVWPLIGLAIAIVLLTVAAVIYPWQSVQDYNKAAQLAEAGEFAEAQALFASLGEFEDAPRQAALNGQQADYAAAVQLRTDGRYFAAWTAFSALGDFADAASQADWCSRKIDYDRATSLLQQQDYAAALTLFTQLGDFADATVQARLCADTLAYGQAVQWMADKKFATASEAFAALGDFKDSAERRIACDNTVIYQQAAEARKAGQYYKAYQLYQSILDFKDSAAKAKACIQTRPNTKVLTRGSGYTFNFAPLRLKTFAGAATYLKIYTTKNKLVATAFIRPGKSLQFNMPKGSFIIKYASGKNWFGPRDMFGDEGTYMRLDQVFKFSSQYNGYEIIFETSNGNLGAKTETRTDF